MCGVCCSVYVVASARPFPGTGEAGLVWVGLLWSPWRNGLCCGRVGILFSFHVPSWNTTVTVFLCRKVSCPQPLGLCDGSSL